MINAGLVIAMTLVVVLAVLLRSGTGMMGGYGVQRFGSNPLSTILWLVFWALTTGGRVLLIVWHAQNANRTSLIVPTCSTALKMKTRYALAEITKDQFDGAKRGRGA